MANYLVVAALEMETPGLEKIAPVIHTGVGKINACIKLYEAILRFKPDLIINYGTAGAICPTKTAGLYQVETFIQRDMDVRALGFARGETPFDTEKLPDAKGITLGTGDSFVTNTEKDLEGIEIAIDLLDMEAFALKKVCEHHQLPFSCYKYVTDTADGESHNDWAENVAKGAELFADLLLDQYGKSDLR
jgi:adenosylhomocysteine nucleosidase